MSDKKVKVGIVIEAFDKATGNLKNINASLKNFTKPVRGLNNQFKMLAETTGLNRLGKSLSGVGSAALGLGKQLAMYGGIAAAGISVAVKQAVDAASAINDLSTATGVSTDKIQTLGYVFEQNGGKSEEFSSGLETFSKNMGQVKAGYGRLTSALKKTSIGKDFLNQLKTSKNTGEAFELLIEQIRGAKTESEKMALATAAVGPAAAGLVNVSKLSKEELAKLRSEIPVIGDEFIKAGDDAGDSFNRLSMTLKATRNNLILSFAPALKALTDGLTSKFNTKEFQEKIRAIGKDINDALLGTGNADTNKFVDIIEAVKDIGRAMLWIVSSGTRLKIALAGVIAIMAGPLLSALATLSATFLTTPIGWFLLAVAAVAGAAYLLIKNWSAVKAFFASIWDNPVAKIVLMMTPITWLVLAARALINNWSGVKSVFTAAFGGPYGTVLKYVTPIGWLITAGQWLIKNWEPVKVFFTELWSGVTAMAQGFLDLIAKIPGVASLLDLKPKITPIENELKPQTGYIADISHELSKTSDVLTPETAQSSSMASGSSDIFGPPIGAEGMAKNIVQTNTNNAEIKVKFEDMPRGARIESRADVPSNLSIDTSYMGLQGAY